LSQFSTLLDTLTDGERTLNDARLAVELGNPVEAERKLTEFITCARPVLDQVREMPTEYVELLGQCFARCLVARAAAWVEQSFAETPAMHALRSAARADIAEAKGLPVAWLDVRARMTLGRLERVLD
jgi:hypothetical protein